jgi:hypothetical protein
MRKFLLAHHHPDAAAPVSGKADANDFHFGRKEAQERVRGGMKAKRG